MLAVNSLELAAQGLDLHILGLAVLAVLAALVQKSGVLVQFLPGFDHPVDGVLDVGILHGPLLFVLCGQLLLHCIERGNVLQLPLHGFLAGKAHGQQGKAVPVHQVHGVLLVVLRVGVLGFEEQRGLLNFEHPLRHEVFNVAHDIAVLLAEALGNVPAGCHRFAVLGG